MSVGFLTVFYQFFLETTVYSISLVGDVVVRKFNFLLEFRGPSPVMGNVTVAFQDLFTYFCNFPLFGYVCKVKLRLCVLS